jgi:hypothetical protein
MRLTSIFFLGTCILGLVYWAWTLTPSRIQYDPLIGGRPKYEDVQKIMSSNDIEFLRQEAIGMKYDEDTIERDRTTVKAMNILGITFILAIALQILLFLEIAARGKDYSQQKL